MIQPDGCRFQLWARRGAKIELVIETDPSRDAIPMSADDDGMYRAYVDSAGPGTRYWFKIDGAGPFPDPASRYQPLGVHGPSQVIAAEEFQWKAKNFRAPSLRELVIYELHVGTFTQVGTFLALIDKLDYLRELGVNAVELMPIADFAGEHNWGYDGVSSYSPAHGYGVPDDFRRFVDQAHAREIAVFLDVVYNHLGPDGAYQSVFAPQFYTKHHKTLWGDGLNFDGDERDKVRTYFIESALAWIYDYRVDGLRADATDTIRDDSEPHFLTELTERVHQTATSLGRNVILIAEDARNERKVILPTTQGGHGFDAVWSDDFHHHMRHRLAGDSDGYYRDFDGTTESIATAIRDGWTFTGEYASFHGHRRGTSPKGLSLESRVFCIQNHDQIGNRAFGERLSTQITYAAWCAASALLLLSPEVPLLFMGQEWAAPEPFLYFTDHNEELGRRVTEGRRKEFSHFSAFADIGNHETIPDPQSVGTFLRSKLDWAVRRNGEHAKCLHWYQTLLHIRKQLLKRAMFQTARALNKQTIEVNWNSASGDFRAVVALEGPTAVSDLSWRGTTMGLSSEEVRFICDPHPMGWKSETGTLSFERAGAVLLAGGDLVDIVEERTQ
ncbi:MAG TPA: malto-oligosyltrehalose trehalohydrolase [Acidobacteriaceae bacterium]|nr:malto-oligosyltrehalose trehalohydrolase [Acidobacteriaceae bacterium]